MLYVMCTFLGMWTGAKNNASSYKVLGRNDLAQKIIKNIKSES